MKVLLVGGGSGGHIFPLVAVQQELLNIDSTIKFIVVTDSMSSDLKNQFATKTKFYRVRSGKIRRFAHWKWYQYFYPARFKFYIWNIIDIFKTVLAILYSVLIIFKQRPDVIFSKSGFVSVPICLVANFKSIPIILHESDTRPGLASRLLKKRAKSVALGMPITDSDSRYVYTGIPVRSSFFKANKNLSREKLKLAKVSKPILLVTGGSLGARRVNQAVIANLPALIKDYYVIHISGETDYAAVVKQTQSLAKHNYRLLKFAGTEYADIVAASDVIIARAGATSIAEFAASAKPVLFIPNSYLTDQVSNAEWLERNNIGVVLDEAELALSPSKLIAGLNRLTDKDMLDVYKKSIAKIAKPDATKRVVQLIVQAANN